MANSPALLVAAARPLKLVVYKMYFFLNNSGRIIITKYMPFVVKLQLLTSRPDHDDTDEIVVFFSKIIQKFMITLR